MGELGIPISTVDLMRDSSWCRALTPEDRHRLWWIRWLQRCWTDEESSLWPLGDRPNDRCPRLLCPRWRCDEGETSVSVRSNGSRAEEICSGSCDIRHEPKLTLHEISLQSKEIHIKVGNFVVYIHAFLHPHLAFRIDDGLPNTVAARTFSSSDCPSFIYPPCTLRCHLLEWVFPLYTRRLLQRLATQLTTMESFWHALHNRVVSCPSRVHAAEVLAWLPEGRWLRLLPACHRLVSSLGHCSLMCRIFIIIVTIISPMAL